MIKFPQIIVMYSCAKKRDHNLATFKFEPVHSYPPRWAVFDLKASSNKKQKGHIASQKRQVMTSQIFLPKSLSVLAGPLLLPNNTMGMVLSGLFNARNVGRYGPSPC